MKRLAQLVLAAALLTTASAASAQSLTEAQARAAIAPWYSLFNQPVQGDMKTLQEQVRDASIKVVGGFAKSIPDMKFEIKEVLVAGDRVIVRGEVTGTPAGDLFRAPYGQELQDHGHRYSNRQRRQDCQDLPPRKLAQCVGTAPRQVSASAVAASPSDQRSAAGPPRSRHCLAPTRATTSKLVPRGRTTAASPSSRY